MNWLLKLLGYRDRDYRGDGFSVRIEPIFREVISVVHTRQGARLNLAGQRIGEKWEGIEVHIPPEVDAEQIPQVVRDLETDFQAMQYGYAIVRQTGTDVVPEEERQAAMSELNNMGYNTSRFYQIEKSARHGGLEHHARMSKPYESRPRASCP